MRAISAAALGFMLLLSAVGEALPAEDITVESTRRDDALEVVCRAVLEAPYDLVWQALTDYNRFAEFIPGMRSSRLIERQGAVAIVEQSGDAGFLFFSFPIDVTIASTERPPHALEVKLLKGDLKRLDGAYRIEPQAGGRILLTWNGTIEAQSMPPLLGEMVMRANIADQFRGMVGEIERRNALRLQREAAGKK